MNETMNKVTDLAAVLGDKTENSANITVSMNKCL